MQTFTDRTSNRPASLPDKMAGRFPPIRDSLLYTGYALALAVSISIWFIAIRSPLWPDETGTFWKISGGFSQIWSRQYLEFPGYAYILWLATKVLGTGEIALRAPSVFAMLAATYLLYRVAHELFGLEVAFIAAIVFCVYPSVIFASIDIRPYAFAVLMTNAAIFALLRLRHNDSSGSAALFGFLAASVLYFHYLFATILPALAIGFFIVKRGRRTAMWRQAGVALGTFTFAFLPVIPGLEYLFRTSGTHVYDPAPELTSLVWALAPLMWILILIGSAVVALIVSAMRPRGSKPLTCFDGRSILLCALLALIPILALYGVSVGTPLHIFAGRYRLAGVPGLAICWALIVGSLRSRALRLIFCGALVMVTSYVYFTSPSARHHAYTWKYAIEAAEKSALPDNAPVLLCSDYPESNYLPMPLHSPKTSSLFAVLSYYKLTVPVVPLPKSLNQQATQIASSFLKKATRRHERFLAIADRFSYPTLAWLKEKASGAYNVRQLGIFDGVKVLEFTPLTRIRASDGAGSS